MTDERVQWDALTYDGSTPERPALSLHLFLKPAEQDGEGPLLAQRLFQDLVSRFYAGSPFLAAREKLADAVLHALEEEGRGETPGSLVRIAVAVVDPLEEEIHLFREGDVRVYLEGETPRISEGEGFETLNAADLDGFALLDGPQASEGIRALGAAGDRIRGRLTVASSTVGIWVPLQPERKEPPAEKLDIERIERCPPASSGGGMPPREDIELSAATMRSGVGIGEPEPAREATRETADPARAEELPGGASPADAPPGEASSASPRKGSRERRLPLLPFALLLLLLLAAVFWERVGRGAPEEPVDGEPAGEATPLRPAEASPEPEPSPPAAPGGTLVWDFRAGAAVTSSPVASENRVFFGSRDGKLYALDSETGARVWAVSGPGGIGSSPTVGGGMVFFGEYGGALVAVSAKDGREIWRRPTAGRIVSSPCYHEGRVYVGSFDRHLYAVGAESGVTIWRRSTGGVVWSSPAVGGDLVLVGSWDGSVYAFRVPDGTIAWRRETGDRVYSSPRVEGEEVYIGTQGGGLLRLERTTGLIVWTARVGSPVHSRPTILEDRVIFGCEDGNVHCADRATGEILWSFPTGARVPSSPHVDRSTVYVASYDEFLYALDTGLGHAEWRAHLGAPAYSSPTSYGDKLYVGTNRGRLLALSLGP